MIISSRVGASPGDRECLTHRHSWARLSCMIIVFPTVSTNRGHNYYYFYGLISCFLFRTLLTSVFVVTSRLRLDLSVWISCNYIEKIKTVVSYSNMITWIFYEQYWASIFLWFNKMIGFLFVYFRKSKNVLNLNAFHNVSGAVLIGKGEYTRNLRQWQILTFITNYTYMFSVSKLRPYVREAISLPLNHERIE